MVHALVERLQRLRHPDAPEQRLHATKQRPRRPREEQEADDDGAEDEHALEPQVCAHVVAAYREQESDRAEEHRRRAADAPLEEHRSGHVGRPSRVATHRVDHAHRVSPERRRQQLPGGVRDEVGAGEPGQMLDDPVRAKEPAPAQREHGDGQHHDQGRDEEPAEARLLEHVDRRSEIDLPEEIRDRCRREEQRPDSPDATGHGRPARTSSVRSSYATFAAATAVCFPAPSYGGLTSTTSYPPNRRPRSALR